MYGLHGTANATIANFKPFFYLFTAFTDCQGLLDIHG
jgi:hypothetical protein